MTSDKRRETKKFVIIGAGISGLSFASVLPYKSYLILEKEKEVGGLCKTIKKEGFIWDYSGHFMHFKDDSLKRKLFKKIQCEIISQNKNTAIKYKNKFIDYPFQENIHQLNKKEFIDCLYDLYFRPKEKKCSDLKGFLISNYGKSICEKFLFPYNSKLYCTGLENLDKDAIGRFFPHADFSQVLYNIREKRKDTYNEIFYYPKKGIFELVKAFLPENFSNRIILNEPVIEIDLNNKRVRTRSYEIEYDYLISTIDLKSFLKLVKIKVPTYLASSKVLVFNFGFDAAAKSDFHWIYVPEYKYPMYRVGFYNNIIKQTKLSLYVEVAFRDDAKIDSVSKIKENILSSLDNMGILNGERLVADHNVIMNPAYVHISNKSINFVKDLKRNLHNKNCYLLGRYAEWKYNSIEDNVLNAFRLADSLKL